MTRQELLAEVKGKDEEGKSHSKVLIIAEHVEFLKLPKRLADKAISTAIKAANQAASGQYEDQDPVF